MQTTTPATNYLNATKGLKSWLLTQDHKRIGIMYLIAIMTMFFIGGLLALILRTELLHPGRDLMGADTYNKFFTLHEIGRASCRERV